jgi:hypothetical protein
MIRKSETRFSEKIMLQRKSQTFLSESHSYLILKSAPSIHTDDGNAFRRQIVVKAVAAWD